jgi:superfamily II DNA or RNA helicase
MKLIVRDPNKGYLDNNLWIPKTQVNVLGVQNALTFELPDRDNGVRALQLWKETPTHLVVPREFWDPTTFNFPVVDCRPKSYEKVAFKSKVVLDTRRADDGRIIPTGDNVQQEAMNALLTSRGGILQLACGKGKTVVAIDLIARRGVPAIVIVDTTQLVKQWRDSIMFFLGLKEEEIGMIGDGEFDWKKPVVIASYTTLANRADDFPEEARRWFGTIIWDEAHHVAAPKFSKSADLFGGMRLGLTATPDRDDGMHVVYNHHIGRVLYKNLSQELKPRIYFKWTGLQLDPTCQATQSATKDKTGELHLGKIANFFGQWRPRLEMVVNEIQQAVAEKRKIIVLSNSVDECVNLLAMWNGLNFLYTDIPFPTPGEVGESIQAVPVGTHQHARLLKDIAIARSQLKDQSIDPVKRQNLELKVHRIHHALESHRVWKKCESKWKKLQKQYIKDLLDIPSNAGLMIYKVDADTRTRLLKEKQVTFAISKYGREGLDEQSLDTVIVLEPLSSRNALQQLMGRVLRIKAGKQEPVVVFLEDDIGPMIGMCKKLRTHLKTWPVEEGGPYEYELLGHPTTIQRRVKSWASVRVSGS